jgi:deoxyribodipyrimidine photo-lyase
MSVDARRTRLLNNKSLGSGPVIYWISRDQRAHDNWALLYAIEKANEINQSVVVAFCLEKYPTSNLRQYDFMLRSLKETADTLKHNSIGFRLLIGDGDKQIPKLVNELKPSSVIVDFSPLKNARTKRQKVAENIDVQMTEVDAHNVVPAWIASDKQEFAAYTIRPKITNLLQEYLTNLPSLKAPVVKWTEKSDEVNVVETIKDLGIDESVKPVDWCIPGEAEAKASMQKFFQEKYDDYAEKRNDPTLDGLSNLSPYIHFGQLGPQRLAYDSSKLSVNEDSKKSFLEELIIRRELSENFCLYNPDYKTTKAFPDWAQKSHDEHKNDKREYLYSLGELEQAKTHDDLWNAAQKQMTERGKMHGYMRMYWAKKILEWTPDIDKAMEYAIYLNDKYELDGRDPNGYTGIAWSIGGLHDRPWFERPIFGKIRYMNYNGAKNKFNIQKYINQNNQQNLL